MRTATTDGPTVTLSVVIPLFNEVNNIAPLMKLLIPVLNTMKVTYEIILVDDGSVDGTWQTILQQSAKIKTIKGIQFSRNFGHQNALYAGLMNAKGQAIVSMDGDLQHPPDIIPQLFQAWQSGYKVVNTRRVDKHVTSWFKRSSSHYFYRFFSFISESNLNAGVSDFRLIDRSVLNNLENFNDTQLFLRGVIGWLGFSHTTIDVIIRKRHSGKSKYSLKKMCAFAYSAIISFSTRPLKLAIWIGVATSLLAFIEIINVITQYFLGETIRGWATTISITALLFGILFIILGIIGAYVASIHEMLQNRPRFIISDKTKS